MTFSLLAAAGCGGTDSGAREIADTRAGTTMVADQSMAVPEGWIDAYDHARSSAELDAGEKLVLDEIADGARVRCEVDARLVFAARIQAWAMTEASAGRSAEPDVDWMRFNLLRLGCADYSLAVLAGRMSEPDRRTLVERAVRHATSWSHCGAGVAGRGDDAMAVVVGTRRRVELEALPVSPAVRQPVPVRGRILEAVRAPLQIHIGRPDGSVQRLPDAAVIAGSFTARFEPSISGRYDLEILADVGQGPETAVLVPLFVGVEPDPRPVVAVDPQFEESGLAPDAALADLIQAARSRAGVGRLERDPRLDRAAGSHCRDMIVGGYFGHVSPTRGPLDARLRAFGLAPSRMAENVARSRSVARLHRNLEASPSHRASMLDPQFTHMGVAVERVGDDYVATEIFASY